MNNELGAVEASGGAEVVVIVEAKPLVAHVELVGGLAKIAVWPSASLDHVKPAKPSERRHGRHQGGLRSEVSLADAKALMGFKLTSFIRTPSLFL